MADIYVFGLFTTWLVLGAVWLAVLGHCLYVYAGAYIQDEKNEAPPNRFIPDSRIRWEGLPHTGGDTALTLVGGFFLWLISGVVWPVAWPIIFCASSLRGARAFVRFQKSYDAHKHDKETGVVV